MLQHELLVSLAESGEVSDPRLAKCPSDGGPGHLAQSRDMLEAPNLRSHNPS